MDKHKIIELYNANYPHNSSVEKKYYSDPELTQKLIKQSDIERNNGPILEIGCGIGSTEDFLKGNHKIYVHSDISHNALKTTQELKESGRHQRFLGVALDAENLPFPNECFSCVIMIDVIEHCFNPQEAITEIARVLKPNGIALFQTNNKLFSMLKEKPSLAHPSVMTYSTFKRYLESAGLKSDFCVPNHFTNFIISQVTNPQGLFGKILSKIRTSWLHPSLYPLFSVIATKDCSQK